jgi:hypothetical protein
LVRGDYYVLKPRPLAEEPPFASYIYHPTSRLPSVSDGDGSREWEREEAPFIPRAANKVAAHAADETVSGASLKTCAVYCPAHRSWRDHVFGRDDSTWRWKRGPKGAPIDASFLFRNMHIQILVIHPVATLALALSSCGYEWFSLETTACKECFVIGQFPRTRSKMQENSHAQRVLC